MQDNQDHFNKKRPFKQVSFLFFLLVISISIAAVDNNPRKGIFGKSILTHWNQKTVVSRKIASFLAPKYTKEISIQTIQSQIAHLESRYRSKHSYQGSWKGVELSNLNATQARFLVNFGYLIGDQSLSQSFKHCSDVICVLNTTYKDKSKLSGYLSYFWYLKTGSMLSASNVVTGQKSKYPGEYNSKHHSFNEYLFSVDELKNFYILAKTLPDQFLHSALLKSIHKIPKGLSVTEGIKSDQCIKSLQTGQILINSKCGENFLMDLTSQIATFLDKSHGFKNRVHSISTSEKWLSLLLWHKESYWDANDLSYKQKWTGHFPKENSLSKNTLSSPTNFLLELIASYRYQEKEFYKKAPKYIQDFIASEFFMNQSFGGDGLYQSFLEKVSNQWIYNEYEHWSKCFHKYFQKELTKSTTRNLASQLNHPLFSCVKEKVSDFVEETTQKLQQEDFEARYFFQDEETLTYRKKFYEDITTLLRESIIKRKHELQTYGEDVIEAQKLKKEFFNSYDTSSIYIKCFLNIDSKGCYEKNLKFLLKKFLYSNPTISKNYQKIFTTEIVQSLNFEDVALNSNKIAKKFLQSYQTQIDRSAKELWTYCQKNQANKNESLILPIKFSGNKFFVDAGVLNCINLNIDDKISSILEQPVFLKTNNSFSLNKNEKVFLAHYFEQSYLQVLNNQLLEDVANEKNYFKNYFKSKKGDIIYQLGHYTPNFLENSFSKSHFHQLCVEKVSSIYPQKYYFHTKRELNNNYGKKICSDYSKQVKVAQKQKEQLDKRWQAIIVSLEKSFKREYQLGNKKCKSSYTEGLKKESGLEGVKFHCNEIAFKKSLLIILEEWKDFEDYHYLSNQEEKITKYFNDKKNQIVSQ